jgi:hypothetical protein
MRNALAHVGAKQRQMVAAAIRTAFTQETPVAARKEWRAVADRLRARFPKLGELMDEAEDDVLAHMSFPKDHWQQIHSTNPLERLNGEIKRRTDVVAIFPNEAAIVRLVGAMHFSAHCFLRIQLLAKGGWVASPSAFFRALRHEHTDLATTANRSVDVLAGLSVSPGSGPWRCWRIWSTWPPPRTSGARYADHVLVVHSARSSF